MQTFQTKLSERETAEARAKITILKWKKKLASDRIVDTDFLFEIPDFYRDLFICTFVILKFFWSFP